MLIGQCKAMARGNKGSKPSLIHRTVIHMHDMIPFPLNSHAHRQVGKRLKKKNQWYQHVSDLHENRWGEEMFKKR